MHRINIEISNDAYNELLKLAKTWHKTLALAMEETKKESWDKENNKIIILEKDRIPKIEAEEFLESLMDSESNAYDSKHLKYISCLVETWRPIAEGPLV